MAFFCDLLTSSKRNFQPTLYFWSATNEQINEFVWKKRWIKKRWSSTIIYCSLIQIGYGNWFVYFWLVDHFHCFLFVPRIPIFTNSINIEIRGKKKTFLFGVLDDVKKKEENFFSTSSRRKAVGKRARVWALIQRKKNREPVEAKMPVFVGNNGY